jgi:hypothetical protein
MDAGVRVCHDCIRHTQIKTGSIATVSHARDFVDFVGAKLCFLLEQSFALCARSQLKDPRPSLVPCSPPRSNSPSAQKPRVVCLGLLPPYQTVPATQLEAREIEVSVAEQANRMPAMCGRGERQEGEDTAEEAVSGRSLEMGRHVETTTHMHHLPLAAQHVTRSRTQHNPNIQNTQSSVHKPAVISI